MGLAVAIVAAAACQATFADEQSGVTIGIPDGWSLFFSAGENQMRLQLTTNGDEGGQIDVATGGAGDAMRAGKWDAYIEAVREAVKRQYPDFELLGTEPRRHGEAPALMIAARYSADRVTYRALKYVVVAQGEVVVTGHVREEGWDAMRGALEKAITGISLGEPVAPRSARGVYSDRSKGFSIDVPARWSVRPSAGRVPCVQMFAGDEFQTTFNVVIQDADERLRKLTVEEMSRELRASYVPQMPDYEVAKAERDEAGGAVVFRVEGRFTQQRRELSNLQRLVLAPKRTYILTWTTLRVAYANREPLFDRAWKTFRVLEPPAGK